MADFRRWITVLAVMALFVGLAGAQTVTSGTTGAGFSCSVSNGTGTPNLRSEGYTEVTGDIVITCTGGSPLALGSPVPTMNVTVYYNVSAVTSRLLTNLNGTAAGVNASEALLLIDEPNGSNLNSDQGYGPLLPQMLCNNPANGAGQNGCAQVVGTANLGGGVFVAGVPVLTSTATGPAFTGTPGPNMYSGVVNGASVTFNGIPVLPPATANFSRVYRITNVRVNANSVGGGVAGAQGQVNASISTNAVQIGNPNPIVGYVIPGLKSSVSGAASFQQCNPQTGAFAGLLNFQENFPTAFKTRVDGSKNGNNSNISPLGGVQNSPFQGTIYNSESDFIANGAGQSVIGGSTGIVQNASAALGSSSIIAGLADYGTRLKAVFSNVPAGATVFVSTTNVLSQNNNAVLTQVAAPGNPVSTASSYAVLLAAGSEATPDGSSVNAASFTNTFTPASISGFPNTGLQLNYVAMTSQGSPMVAVWEVLNTQPTFQETITFAVYFAYASTATFPPIGNSQVAFSLAANPSQGAFSASNGGTTAVNTPIPRFVDTSGSSLNPIANLLTVGACQTVLLFPYVTSVTGFDTGLSIANTTTDPFKTTPQQGVCTLYWYNTNGANPPNTTTAVVPSGQTLLLAASAQTNAGVGFSGYMIAQCYFQLAHGFAAVTDVGAQKILSVYLALVVTTGPNARNSYTSTSPEALNN